MKYVNNKEKIVIKNPKKLYIELDNLMQNGFFSPDEEPVLYDFYEKLGDIVFITL